MEKSSRIILASTNAHKVAELKDMFARSDLSAQVLGMHDFGQPPPIEESAPDFAGNARLKSEGIARWLGQRGIDRQRAWVLADDSGLCVDALGGAPGVISARYAGVGACDAENNQKLVRELSALGLKSSPARFCCVLALTSVQTLATQLFEGEARGHAQVEAQGEHGFGYDPHVWLEGHTQSFAQMSRETKSKHSHRAHALTQLFAALPSLLDPPRDFR